MLQENRALATKVDECERKAGAACNCDTATKPALRAAADVDAGVGAGAGTECTEEAELKERIKQLESELEQVHPAPHRTRRVVGAGGWEPSWILCVCFGF
jgi:hypothetical protein